MTFTLQICFAAEETEDIDSYFTEDTPQTTELQGYLQYSEQEQEQEEQNTVNLENSSKLGKLNITTPKKISTKSFLQEAKKANFDPFQYGIESASRFSTPEYDITPVNSSYTQNFGKFSVGTSYNSSLDVTGTNYSTGVFSRYDGKHFAISTTFSKNTNSNYDSYSDNLSIAPELKLTKRLSFMDVMQTDVNQIYKSNELVLKYTPKFKKHRDDVEFRLGAGQSFYEDNYIKSSVSFSTKFKI